jgi:cytochrome b
MLVAAFVVAYVTEDDWMRLHASAGYVIAGLLVFRLIWGFLGPRHARFSDFVFSPRVVVAYLKDTLIFRARRYLGHNPAGGAMIVALLVSLTLATVSGLALYGVAEHAGPMAGLLSGFGSAWENPLEEVHEFFANFTLMLVFVHVAGVLFESLAHRENLVRAMWTGTKRAAD